MKFPIFPNYGADEINTTKIIFDYILHIDYTFTYASNTEQSIERILRENLEKGFGQLMFYREARHFMATPEKKATNDIFDLSLESQINYQSVLSILYTIKTWQQEKAISLYHLNTEAWAKANGYNLNIHATSNWSSTCNKVYNALPVYIRDLLQLERSPIKSEPMPILEDVEQKESLKTKCLSQPLVRDVFDNAALLKLALFDKRIKSIYKDAFETLSQYKINDPEDRQNMRRHKASIVKKMKNTSASWLELYNGLKYSAPKNNINESEWLLNETCYEFHKEQIFHFKLVKSLFDNFKLLLNDTKLDLSFNDIRKLLLKAYRLGDIYFAGTFVDAIVKTRSYTNTEIIFDNWISKESDTVAIGTAPPREEPVENAEELAMEKAHLHWKTQFDKVISYLSYLSVPISERLLFLKFLECPELTNNIEPKSANILDKIEQVMKMHILNQDTRGLFLKSLDFQTKVAGSENSLSEQYFVEIEDFEDAKIFIAILHELFCSHEAKEIHDRTFTKKYFVPREGSDYFKNIRSNMILGTIDKNK